MEEIIPETRDRQTFHMLEDSKGYIWIASSDIVEPSLYRLSPDLGSLEVFQFKEWDPFVFRGGRVFFLHESRTGLVWMGSEKDGVFMVDLNARQFKTIDDYPERGLYITDNEVYSIYEDPSEQLYVGTKSELNRINLRNGRTFRFNNEYNLKRDLTYEYAPDLPAALIGVMTEHSDGRIWMGAFDYKVSLYDSKTSSFLNFHMNDNDPEAFRIWSLRSICVTADNQIYFGGTGEGLSRLNEDGHSFHHFPVVNTGEPTGTNDTHIQYIYEDSEGILWLGCLSGGLNRFDPKLENSNISYMILPIQTPSQITG